MTHHTKLPLPPAFQRLGADIKQIAPDLHILIMDDAGNLTLDGAPQAEADIAPPLVDGHRPVGHKKNKRAFRLNGEYEKLNLFELRWVLSQCAGVFVCVAVACSISSC
jgi:hypothetical protein